MTYPYGTKGAPAVGGGLPGLPRRDSATRLSGNSAIVIHDVTLQGEPQGLVPWGSDFLRSDYPKLSKLFPPTRPEQIIGLPDFDVPIPSVGAQAYVVTISPNEKFIAFGYSPGTGTSTTNPLRLSKRSDNGWGPAVSSSPNSVYTFLAFTPDSEYLIARRRLSSSTPFIVFKVNENATLSQLSTSITADSISVLPDSRRFWAKDGTKISLYEIQPETSQVVEIYTFTDSQSTGGLFQVSPRGDLLVTSSALTLPTRRRLRAFAVDPITNQLTYSSTISASLEDTDLQNGCWFHPSGDWAVRYSYADSARGPGLNLFKRDPSGIFEHRQFIPAPSDISYPSIVSNLPECFSPDGLFYYSMIHLQVYGFSEGALVETGVSLPSTINARPAQGMTATENFVAATFTGSNRARIFGQPHKALAFYRPTTMFFEAK